MKQVDMKTFCRMLMAGQADLPIMKTNQNSRSFVFSALLPNDNVLESNYTEISNENWEIGASVNGNLLKLKLMDEPGYDWQSEDWE